MPRIRCLFYRFLLKEGFWLKRNPASDDTCDTYIRHDPAIGGISVVVHVEGGRARATLRYNHTAVEVANVDELARELLKKWRAVMASLHHQARATVLRRLDL